MKRRLIYWLKLLALVSFTAYFSSSSVLKAQNNSKSIEITDKDGKSVVLYEQSHALIIWVHDYQHWGDLEAVPKGAKLLEDALKQRGFNVIVAENPNSQELRAVVHRFIGDYGYDKNNRLVVFFAGHGATIDETDGYIVPSDAPDPITDESGFFRLAISMEEVMAWARRIRSNHALFLFDSCFSGTLFETKTRPNPNNAYIRTVTGKPVRQFLTAGDAGEEVPAGNDFVRLFIQGLDGEADINRDGYVTGLEIGAFVQITLPGLTENAQSPQYGKIQNARLRQGDIVFRSLNKPISSNLPSSALEDIASEDDSKKSPLSFRQPLSPLSEREIENQAREITVEILVYSFIGESPRIRIGSGVLVKREGNRYYVITNDHVVGENRSYAVTVRKSTFEEEYSLQILERYPEQDLAVLRFTSEQNYDVAKIADPNNLIKNENAYVFGFPIVEESGKFVSVRILDIDPLNYDPIIPDSHLETGMGGSPILNSQGELIGIHQKSGEIEIDRSNTDCTDKCVGIPVKNIIDKLAEF